MTTSLRFDGEQISCFENSSLYSPSPKNDLRPSNGDGCIYDITYEQSCVTNKNCGPVKVHTEAMEHQVQRSRGLEHKKSVTKGHGGETRILPDPSDPPECSDDPSDPLEGSDASDGSDSSEGSGSDPSEGSDTSEGLGSNPSEGSDSVPSKGQTSTKGTNY